MPASPMLSMEKNRVTIQRALKKAFSPQRIRRSRRTDKVEMTVFKFPLKATELSNFVFFVFFVVNSYRTGSFVPVLGIHGLNSRPVILERIIKEKGSASTINSTTISKMLITATIMAKDEINRRR
jgi:hypothetical protein